MNILQEIFCDHFEEIEYTCHPRDVEMENIEKMIHCGDPSFGGALYCCPKCAQTKFVPFRCRSRFCPTCGALYSIKRTTAMSFKLIAAPHRHCVFTIAEELRSLFLVDRSLLSLLFSAVNQVISRLFYDLNHSRHFVPGFICVLHTFGRDLKWNPHIHCLVSEGGIDKFGLWRSVSHFNYSFLRHAFQTVLLNLLQQKLPPEFKRLKAAIYRNSKNGFYVYAKSNKCNPSSILNYIGRYLGRPVIATSRIDSYDKVADTVTFHYNRHEDDLLVHETIPAMDFIKRLMRHIPEKHFKMIRYYGIYARHRHSDSRIRRAIPKEKHNAFALFASWRAAIISAFGYDPIACPSCGSTMAVLDLFYKHHRVSLEDLYEKAKRKFRLAHPNVFPSLHRHVSVLLSPYRNNFGGAYFAKRSYSPSLGIH